jgi:hypothetical protein
MSKKIEIKIKVKKKRKKGRTVKTKHRVKNTKNGE